MMKGILYIILLIICSNIALSLDLSLCPRCGLPANSSDFSMNITQTKWVIAGYGHSGSNYTDTDVQLYTRLAEGFAGSHINFSLYKGVPPDVLIYNNIYIGNTSTDSWYMFNITNTSFINGSAYYFVFKIINASYVNFRGFHGNTEYPRTLMGGTNNNWQSDFWYQYDDPYVIIKNNSIGVYNNTIMVGDVVSLGVGSGKPSLKEIGEDILKGASIIHVLRKWNPSAFDDLNSSLSNFIFTKDFQMFMNQLSDITVLLFKYVIRQPSRIAIPSDTEIDW